MSLLDYENAVKLIRLHSDQTYLVGKRSLELVMLAEKVLGLTFPNFYRQFLLDFGAGSVGGMEIYGIINDDFVNSSVPDAIWYTLNLRRETKIPHDYVVIAAVGDGRIFVLDTDNTQMVEGQMHLYYPGLLPSEQPDEKVSSEFSTWFYEEVKRELSG